MFLQSIEKKKFVFNQKKLKLIELITLLKRYESQPNTYEEIFSSELTDLSLIENAII